MTGIGRKTDTWGSRFGFIMAAVGSSVGLGRSEERRVGKEWLRLLRARGLQDH